MATQQGKSLSIYNIGGFFKKPSIYNIERENKLRDKLSPHQQARSDAANRIASWLVKKFKAPDSYNFFLKCGWHLSEDEIVHIYELSQRKNIKKPLYYFIRVANNKMS